MASTEQLLKKILEQEKIESLIHVGGHKGEEADFYNSYGLSRVIYFEPIKQFYLEIIEKIKSKNLSNFEAFNIALGSENKNEEIYVADGDSSGSSSLLEPRPSDITFSKKEMIEIKTYTSLGISNIDLAVIDTQGYELEVLKGMGDQIKEFKYLVVEFSLFEGYINQVVFKELEDYLNSNSFTRVKTIRKLSHKKYNDSNYGDAIYLNNNLLKETNRKIYLLKNKIIDSRLYFFALIFFDFPFHLKKIKQIIKKIIRR